MVLTLLVTVANGDILMMIAEPYNFYFLIASTLRCRLHHKDLLWKKDMGIHVPK